MRSLVTAVLVLLVFTPECTLGSVETLWPQPANVVSGSGQVELASSSAFAFVADTSSACAGGHLSLLHDALVRYVPLVFWRESGIAQRRYGERLDVRRVQHASGVYISAGESSIGASSSLLSELRVCVQKNSTDLDSSTNEEYWLNVAPATAPSKAILTAVTVFGAMRGLETFTQLVELQDSDHDVMTIASVPLEIRDFPRFAWRGLLLDTARHYLPVSLVLREIDAMTANKLNVLHWHVVDAQSFPFQPASSAASKLGKGAYHSTAVFTVADVQKVVEYGRQRGVRVVPEFDGPGHAAAWGVGYPAIVANCPKYEHNINNIPLSPATPLTWEVVDALYSELAELFPDAAFHVGGDEVVFGCWLEDPEIVAWMRNNNVPTATALYAYFVKTMVAKAAKLGKTEVLAWQEVFTHDVDVPKDVAVIEVWKDAATLRSVVEAGYRSVLAAGNYLDRQIPNATDTFYGFESTWQNFYNNDPYNGLDGLTAAQKSLVLGGESAMWGEQITSESIDARMWPRACATAERLWSPANVTDIDAAKVRLHAQSCRLRRRGVHAGDVMPGYCIMP